MELANIIRNEPKPLPSKSELEHLYVKERKSMRKIGEMYSTYQNKIRSILIKYEIEIFKKGDWAIGLTKETHSGIRRHAESRKGVHRSPETIQKIRESGTFFEQGHIPWIKGKTHSKETKRKLSEAQTGKKASEQAKKNMSAFQKGHKVSKETRKKIAAALTGKKRPAEVIKKMSKTMTKKYQQHPELGKKHSKLLIKHY